MSSAQDNPSNSENQLHCGETLPNQVRGIYFAGFGESVQEKTVPLQSSSWLSSFSRSSHVWVEVKAVGVNPVDAKHVIGDKLYYDWKRTRQWSHRCLVQQTRVGFDFAGIVAMDHQDFPRGTRVFGTMPPFAGSFAEYIHVPLHQIARAPETLSLKECAALPLVGLTAWQALQPYVIPDQSNVLVLGGSGGTGHVALQVAKGLGARQVVTVCSTANVRFVKETCGADHVVDYKTSPDILQELRQYGPFDLVLDCVTSADPADRQYEYPKKIRQSTEAAAPLVTPDHLYQRLGGVSSDWIRAGLARPKIFPHSWLWKDPRERLFWIRFPHSSHELAALAEMADSGKLKPHIAKEYPSMTAETVQDAFDAILSRRVQGKVVVLV